MDQTETTLKLAIIEREIEQLRREYEREIRLVSDNHEREIRSIETRFETRIRIAEQDIDKLKENTNTLKLAVTEVTEKITSYIEKSFFKVNKSHLMPLSLFIFGSVLLVAESPKEMLKNLPILDIIKAIVGIG